jgi:hypothetical protein
MSDSEIEYITAALQWKFGWLIGLAAWQTLVRAVMVFVNNQFKAFLEQAIPEDQQWAKSLFNHRGYRLLSFLLNMAVSVKLPMQGRKAGDTTQLTKPA